jgi:hypothetical protein
MQWTQKNPNFMFLLQSIKMLQNQKSVTAMEHCSYGYLARTVQNCGNCKMWEHETGVLLYSSKNNPKITIFNSNV